MLGMVNNNIRIVSVESVDYQSGIITTRWTDDVGNEGPKINIPHPYVGTSGEGIFIGIGVGSLIAIGMSSQQRPVPIGIIRSFNNNFDLSSQPEASFDFSGNADIKPGNIIIKGPNDSSIVFGNTHLDIKNSNNEGLFFYDDLNILIQNDPSIKYIVSQKGISSKGIVRREIQSQKEISSTGLTNSYYEFYVEDIGWDVGKNISLETDLDYRNPPLVEDREIIFEYGKDFLVGTYDEEVNLRNGERINHYYDGRRQRRTNVLSLSLTCPNELIEKSKGTLVDIFGNILDVNKNIINRPVGTTSEEFLNNVFENMRHSVAYHMAINTRKGWSYRNDVIGNTAEGIFSSTLLTNGIPDVNNFANNSKDRSKWEINVDKEGLTVINIPSTSETGTVPRLVRYETSSVLNVNDGGDLEDGQRSLEDSKKIFPNSKNKDIFVEQVGPGGIQVIGNQIENRAKDNPVSWVEDEKEIKKSPSFIQAGTAFHDIRSTVKSILNRDFNLKAYEYKDLSSDMEQNKREIIPDPDAVSSEINASIPDLNNPALLQKIYIEGEEIIIETTTTTIDVINGEVLGVSSIILLREDLSYNYDLEKQKYYIKDKNLLNDPNSLIMSSLSDKSIKLNVNLEKFPNFPMPKNGDKILISYYYKGKQPNAGGRSVVLNLDGSLETSIGANTVDRVSWTLDTAGAVIARLGRDKNGRSALIQADGYVAIEIGGWDYVGEDGKDEVDTRFVGQGIDRKQSLKKDPYRFKGGKLVLRIRRSESTDPGSPDKKENDHLIIIDDTGITLKSAGVLNLISEQTLNLQSKSNITFNAPNVIMYENSTMREYVRRKANPNGLKG